MIDLGDTYTLTAEARDAAGTLANATTVALTITLPDGTAVTPSPANPPTVTGKYAHPFVTSMAGRHVARWVFTGAVPDQAWTDTFEVAPQASLALVSLADVKTHLNIAADNTDHDDELRGFIASVTDVIEDVVGVVARRTFVETYSGRGERAILLRRRPVVSVTSVVESGTTVAASDYSVTEAGVLTRASAYSAGRWASGVDNVTVTYVAGRPSTPPSVLDAAKELIRINWRPQQGGNYSVFNGGRADDFGQTGAGEVRLGFFVPNTVMQRLQPHSRGPHIA